MLPLPDDLAESALQEVANIASNFTVHSWEGDVEMRNQSMLLLGKMATALLETEREQVLDKFTEAAMEVRALISGDDVLDVTAVRISVFL